MPSSLSSSNSGPAVRQPEAASFDLSQHATYTIDLFFLLTQHPA